MKTGINPSLKTTLDTGALTATQKIFLTKNRIWGNMIGGNCRSGYKELKKAFDGESRAAYYDNSNLKMVYPFIAEWEDQNTKKIKYEERKARIFMRGIKIGTKRTGEAKTGMAMFQLSGKKGAEEGQELAEAIVKEKLTDDLLL